MKQKELAPRDLMDEYTDALLHDDRGAKYVFKNSKYSKQLVELGKAVIKEIGRYLKTKSSEFSQCTEREKHIVEHGWILLLCGIVENQGIDTGSEIFGDNFTKWANWALDYTPD